MDWWSDVGRNVRIVGKVPDMKLRLGRKMLGATRAKSPVR